MSKLKALVMNDVPSGLPGVGAVPWGSHLCHFYRSRDDLAEALVSYFRAGLDHNDKCLWMTCEPLGTESAREALATELADLEQYEARGQIEIVDFTEWYTRAGTLDGDTAVRMWLEREQAARDQGFAGLRIAGNVFRLERDDWDSFTEYEAAVHRAFRGRNVLALCSYSLDCCSIDDVLDVLQNHEFALLRRDGVWELIRSATQLVAAVKSVAQVAPEKHVVHFFSEERYPSAAVAQFLGEGIERGHRAAAIGTRKHLDAIGEALAARDLSLESLVTLDAEAMLAACTDDGQLEVEKLRRRLTRALDQLSPDGSKLYVYGEIVDILSRDGKTAPALAVEKMWNDILAERPLALFCAYELSSFRSDEHVDAYLSVCDHHGDVRLDAAPTDQDVVTGVLTRAIQRRKELDAERARHTEVEHDASKRLASLQRVTSALSRVRAIEAMGSVFERDICPILGANRALVARAGHKDEQLGLVCRVGEPTDDECFGGSPVDARLAAAEVFRTRGSIWLRNPLEIASSYKGVCTDVLALAAVPLRLAGRGIGAVMLGFPEPQRFDLAQRALIDDVVHQVTLTLDRVLLFEETEQQRDRMVRASRAKDGFLAMLGHELRNPLAAIRSASELLKLTSTDSSVQRTQAVLERQTAHMAKLLEGLLDVSRMIRGKVSVDKEPVDLVGILREVLSDRFPRLEDRGLLLRTEIDEPSLWVRGDGVRMAQVLDNLLSNAVKFSEPGGTITVAARAEEGCAVVSVRDEGLGIDRELLPYVFEPFQQGSQELARPAGGLGLGLAVVKGLVELHGGSVTARSEGRGQGATLEFCIPLSEEVASKESEPPRSGAASSTRMLVIEDNEDTADLLNALLQTIGHESSVAYDGERALTLARELKPDVILCDIGLPGLSGYDVARRFRQDTELQDAYLVALTGYGRPEDVARAMEAGFDVHLTKPIDIAAVEQLVADARRSRLR